MNGFEIGEFVVVCVDADAKEEACVAAIDDFMLAKLDKVGLVFLIAGRNEAVDFAFEFYFFFVAEGRVPFC
jgi:hypothetical protein